MNLLNCAGDLKMPIKNKLNSGTSLVELMIALGVSAVVITGTMLFLSNSDRSRELLDQMATRDAIASRIGQTAGLPAAIATAMLSNTGLSRCVLGDSTVTACDSSLTDPSTQQPFDLSVPLGTAGLSKVAGFPPGPPAPASPTIYYDIKGRPSTQAESLCRNGASVVPSKRCPFFAVSTFWASCPDTASSCPFASFINVRYQLRTWQPPAGTASSELPFGGFSMANVPPDPEFTADKTSYSIPVSADQIRKYGGSACTGFHPLAILNKDPSVITTSNNAICVCPTGFIRTPANMQLQLTNCTPDPLQNKVCADTATGEKCIMVGIRRNNVPVCRTVAERLACVNINLSTNQACTVNGAPGWIDAITVGTCTVVQPPVGKKGAGEIEITCATSTGRCCNFTSTINQADVNTTACGT